ncbi:uncharacterized protein MYCFIDRAFT_157466 [Pseudocercospora fijiensis CIRAD86]|uniref:Rhodanese domain-containing protein n=1 Tax=Pseudocercospora fijiensis (strain CIRAD86) TaxID=383855 RepID=M3AMP0_PSEFD|nr:uncharacterized protein MYCFIDRAFT_157466 [Pseudocercospora fijiensis CIRAD86]EME78712.1 hypothetical protein MYCFIDRAFT_157466 [Pseudocercospora fijiensis CIRAD86]
MASINPLNVYTGTDSLKKYFNPESAPPLPLVELPPHLNPYYDHGVRIYAKMMSCHPANNVKSMPAMNLLQKEVHPDKTKTIVEYSSGSTVISMSMVARVFHGITDSHAYLSNKTTEAKLRLMQFFGLKLTLFGGPSQPDPRDERGGIQNARLQAERSESTINPNQYENDANWQSHVKWTGPQILQQLPHISIICAGMGTSGTMTGLGTFFKRSKPSVFRLGVCTAAGDRVPGPRSYALLAPVEFPWKQAVDHVEHVGSFDSFSLSLQLCRNGLVCGPSSGFNLQGLFNLLEKRKQESTLTRLRSDDGLVHAVFLCCDLPYQYLGEYFDKLGQEAFPPITNEYLTKVDKYRYDEAWELSPSTALPLRDELVLDLRRLADFREFHFPSSLHVPLDTLDSSSPSPFYAPETLSRQWTELESLFSQSFLQSQFAGRKLLCLCYDGDTSRVATSILRAKGFEAASVKGGFRALIETHPSLSGLQVVAERKNNSVVLTITEKRAGSPAFTTTDKRADSLMDEWSDRALTDSDDSDKKSEGSLESDSE